MIIIIIIIRIPGNVYGLPSSHTIARVHPVHLLYAEQCQVATERQIKPTDLGRESACRLL